MSIPIHYIEFFEKFFIEEKNHLIEIIKGNSLYDYFDEKLEERNQELFNIINDLNGHRLKIEIFRNFVVKLEQLKYKKEDESLTESIAEYHQIGRKDYISIKKLESNLAYQENLNFEKFVEKYSSLYDSLNKVGFEFNCTVKEYCAFNIVKLLYKHYCKSIKRFLIPENNSLEKLYLGKGLELNKFDTQYSKHKLLTIDENFTFSDSNLPKVYDKRVEEFIFIEEISFELLDLLKSLIKQGYIGSLALRPSYTLSGNGLSDFSLALEEMERGKIFTFENLGFPSVAKLYSKEYDNLWVVIDEKNITFEEILQDFCVYEDNVVTQVVHLEYECLDSLFQWIVHIDHEYIFYTKDEFRLRQNNHKQKGNAKKRYKTFKIDNSKIPFEINGEFILYSIIEKYFKKKELLKEYFQEVMNE